MQVIKYVIQSGIDKVAWDRCLAGAINGSLYGTSFYLDALADEWDALVAGDYEFVMPLIHRKKIGIRYLYQPPFLPAVAIYAAALPSDEIVAAFLAEAARNFRFAEFRIFNFIPQHLRNTYEVSEKTNFVIDLHLSYENISQDYDKHFTKSLRRLKKLPLQFKIDTTAREIISVFSTLYLPKINGLREKDVARFYEAVCMAELQGNCYTRAVFTDDRLLCAVIILQFKNRLYNLMSCNTPEGKKTEANYYLYDRIIEEFSGKGLVFDLEGSDIKGIADFYKKMNPVNEPYFSVKFNSLPPVLKLFKK